MIDRISSGASIAPTESTQTPKESFGKVLKGVSSPGGPPRTPGASGSVPAGPADAPRPVEATAKPPTATQVRPAVGAGSVPKPTGTQIVGQIAESQRQLDRILKMAESGKTFSPAELLAFQAHAYRASQEIDMASKVVDKATGAVKQTLQTQV